jgi:hypothetical protein
VSGLVAITRILDSAAASLAGRSGFADHITIDEHDDTPPTMVPLVIEPMLADRDGVLVRSGTPKGRGLLQAAYDRARTTPGYVNLATIRSLVSLAALCVELCYPANGPRSDERIAHEMEEPMADLDEVIRQNKCLKACGDKYLAVEQFWVDLIDSRKIPVSLALAELQKATKAHVECTAKCVPQRRRFTDEEKKDFLNGGIALLGASGICVIAGVGAASEIFGSEGALAIIAAIGIAFAGAAIRTELLLLDPDDPNFTELPVPSFSTLPPVQPVQNTRLTASVAAAANAVTANQAQGIGLLNALLTALNRADSAADAGDKAAEAKQVQAAQGFAKQLANVLRDAASLRLTLAGLWTGADLDFIIPKKDVITYRDDAFIKGFPTQFLDSLTKLGFDQQDQDTIRQELIVQLADVSGVTQVRFRDLLTDAKLRAGEIGIISALERFARP